MTSDGLVQDLRGSERRAGSRVTRTAPDASRTGREDRIHRARRKGGSAAKTGLPDATIISICDRLLGEIARREHTFSWLRPSVGQAGDWLSVDAYYPAHRLVVSCRAMPVRHLELFRELVPKHGLLLLELSPSELGGDEERAEAALRQMLAGLGRPRGSAATSPSNGPAATSRSNGSAATSPPNAGAATSPSNGAATAASNGRARVASRVVIEQSRAPSPRSAGAGASGPIARAAEAGATGPAGWRAETMTPLQRQALGVLVGVSLAAALVTEVYIDLAKVAFAGGRVMLAFAIALDTCSRGLGTISAGRAGRPAWACACAIGGSPVVAWLTVLRRRGPLTVEPAPLAGLLSVFACVIAFIAWVLGS